MNPLADILLIALGSIGAASFYVPFKKVRDSQRPRAVIGMFDVKVRPCVPAGVLTFSVPMIKFTKMISYMDERFLITDSWKEVQKCIK